jgi:hypothetical protein
MLKKGKTMQQCSNGLDNSNQAFGKRVVDDGKAQTKGKELRIAALETGAVQILFAIARKLDSWQATI